MATVFQPFARFRVFDINGNPGHNFRLHTYVAGTVNTPKATFQDLDGLVPNTNPVIFDPFGEADIRFAIDELYKLELRDAQDNLQWTVDNYGSATGVTQGSPNSGRAEATVRLTSFSGQERLVAAGMFPAGVIPVGGLIYVETSFGNGQGLTGLTIGPSGSPGMFGQGISMLSGSFTTPGDYVNYAPAPVSAPTDLIILAETGAFDGTGSLLVTGFWETQQAVQTLP